MKNKYILISLLMITIIFVTIFIFRLIGPEDTYICENGEWIRHGNPSSALPDKICE